MIISLIILLSYFDYYGIYKQQSKFSQVGKMRAVPSLLPQHFTRCHTHSASPQASILPITIYGTVNFLVSYFYSHKRPSPFFYIPTPKNLF